MILSSRDCIRIGGALILLFLAAVLCRPALPIDETRYLSVAWEMHLNHNWFLLTMNFAPYHHKPPLLFWAINLMWAVFGVSRWAAIIPPALAAAGCVFLTARLAQTLFPGEKDMGRRSAYILLGGAPFLIYGTLILFDFTLAFFTLAALVFLLRHAEKRSVAAVLGAGLCLGLGVLTKGPVAYLDALPPALLAPLWMSAAHDRGKGSWYGGLLAAVAVSAVPVAVWLLPTLREADGQFASWLLWNQTAGRITGNFSEAHVRPFYFYLMLAPVMFLPWLFMPAFFRGARTLRAQWEGQWGLRFLACWMIPVFVAFSLISGKQPHYLVPLVPGAAILTAFVIRAAAERTIMQVCAALVVLLAAGQGIARFTFFPDYDLRPIASWAADHPDRDLAYTRQYHGEWTFLGRLTRPVESVPLGELDEWFTAHPHGAAVIRYKNPDDVKHFNSLLTIPYRGKQLGVFEAPAGRE